jgi:hypothetical protein
MQQQCEDYQHAVEIFIEQASQRIGGTGDSGGSTFAKARRKSIAAFERITGYLEQLVRKLKQAASPSDVARDPADVPELSESDDMGM